MYIYEGRGKKNTNEKEKDREEFCVEKVRRVVMLRRSVFWRTKKKKETILYLNGKPQRDFAPHRKKKLNPACLFNYNQFYIYERDRLMERKERWCNWFAWLKTKTTTKKNHQNKQQKKKKTCRRRPSCQTQKQRKKGSLQKKKSNRCYYPVFFFCLVLFFFCSTAARVWCCGFFKHSASQSRAR